MDAKEKKLFDTFLDLTKDCDELESEWFNNPISARACLNVSKEYAKQTAIEFAEFTAIGLWTTYDGMWYQYMNEDNPLTGDQLFELYLEQSKK